MAGPFTFAASRLVPRKPHAVYTSRRDINKSSVSIRGGPDSESRTLIAPRDTAEGALALGGNRSA
jgi:hypothetical protein